MSNLDALYVGLYDSLKEPVQKNRLYVMSTLDVLYVGLYDSLKRTGSEESFVRYVNPGCAVCRSI